MQREGVYPYGFPHDFGALFRYSLNRTIDAHYHPSAIPHLAPFLWRYWKHSRPARHKAIAHLYAKLIEHCLTEHDALAAEAGSQDLFRRTGWMKIFRTERERDLRFAEAERWRGEFGLNYKTYDARTLQELEPHLAPVLVGALHWTDPLAARRSAGSGARVPAAFREAGRALRAGQCRDARARLARAYGGWISDGARRGHRARAVGRRGDARARLRPAARGEARLPHALSRRWPRGAQPPDARPERGYFLAPMRRGIRLTTGAEFARRDGMKTPVQLNRAEPIARELFPLAERLDTDAWMGSRPCTPDMMPVIGRAPKHERLWFAFGHAHHGFTLGPVTGRLIAEMVTGEAPFVDPSPYRAERF